MFKFVNDLFIWLDYSLPHLQVGDVSLLPSVAVHAKTYYVLGCDHFNCRYSVGVVVAVPNGPNLTKGADCHGRK
jgi:hypothetical protein